MDDQEQSIEKDLQLLNKEKEENKKIKQENIDLIKIKKELEKEIIEKKLQLNQLISNIYKQNDANIKNKFNIEFIIISYRAIQPTQRIQKRNPLDEFMSPTLIGLNNIGATGFMNSTLQCLSQTKELTKYFLNEENEDKILNNNVALKDRNSLQLCPAYLDLIHELWSNNSKRPFSPNGFIETIEQMNPLFKLGQAGDPKIL